MSQIEDQHLSVQIKIKPNDELYSLLEQYGTLYNTISRKLYNIYSNNENVDKNTLKRNSLKDFNIHSRIFESCLVYVKGMISAKKELHKYYQKQYDIKIKDIQKEIKKCKNKHRKHKLKLKLQKYKDKLNKQVDYTRTWGSSKYYKKQWNCTDKTAWKSEWNRKRNYNFTLVGSKDETNGNSLCQLKGNNLFLTIPHCLQKDDIKHCIIPIEFKTHKNNDYYKYFFLALKNKIALTYNFIKEENGFWYINISFKITNNIITQDKCIGIDFNHNLICTSYTDKKCNFVDFKQYKFDSDNMSSEQATNELSHICIDIVDNAIKTKSNIVIEDLDLEDKKCQDNGADVNRKLSQMQYNKFFMLLKSRCIKNGVSLIKVNPAYTSIIGKFKYKKKFGVTTHIAAAYTIARRGMNCKERIPSKIDYILQRGDSVWTNHTRYKHYWNKWNYVNKNYEKCLLKNNTYLNLDLNNVHTDINS